MPLRRLVLLFMVLGASLAPVSARGQDSSPARTSMHTTDRWNNPGWWPTKGTAAPGDYAGASACTRCHAEIAASQKATPIFNAARLARDSPVFQRRPEYRFSDETYNYVLSRGPKETTFTVTRAASQGKADAVTAVVGWAFGDNSQTYILKRGDKLFDSRLSYFENLAGLDITPGHAPAAPAEAEQALGNPLSEIAARRCFGCHTTGSTVAGNFDPGHAVLGVTCEACHGPGAAHVLAMDAHQYDAASSTTLNPKKLAPIDSVDFCGACHRTRVDVVLDLPPHIGLTGVRFQPSRLERSLCWGSSGDPRITCIACHDPHKPLVTDTSSYDKNCLKCHAAQASTAANMAPACTVGSKDCVSCHMPKYEIPWAHEVFTDHFIRVVRENEPFPE